MDSEDAIKKRYASALVRGDYLAEENQRLKKENKLLRLVDNAALTYCEAASEGLPYAKLDALFGNLVSALRWRRERP